MAMDKERITIGKHIPRFRSFENSKENFNLLQKKKRM
jgi:hypothetical protein